MRFGTVGEEGLQRRTGEGGGTDEQGSCSDGDDLERPSGRAVRNEDDLFGLLGFSVRDFGVSVFDIRGFGVRGFGSLRLRGHRFCIGRAALPQRTPAALGFGGDRFGLSDL